MLYKNKKEQDVLSGKNDRRDFTTGCDWSEAEWPVLGLQSGESLW